ncbi:hypothetical protein [Novosphingobium gossypii]|uniref:hypothetical protein n=1 Tax=Novosphingobium gossypii TaxID=1604774 RepID=UPI003D1E2997
MRLHPERKGIFRTTLPGMGECARVAMSAGDAAPFLERDMYEMLGFHPRFEDLPERPHAMPSAGAAHGIARA